ncbi:MAG: helix-turn-helix domain-containing protein [Armatimonadota bacterium]
MGAKIGPVIRRLRERHRLTQQDLVDYAGLDRSSSYVSAVEIGRTSPTLAELEAIAQVFRTTVIGLIQEAQEDASNLSVREKLTAEALFEQLSEANRSLAIDFMTMLRERERRQQQEGSKQ